MTIHALQQEHYQEVQRSPIFPDIPKQQLYTFLQNCAQHGETQAKRDVRAWIRQKPP